MKRISILFLLMVTVFSVSAQKFEGLAPTPPMGWNSWNRYACDIDENLIRQTAKAMVDRGLKDAGYIYVNIDDCWQGERDSLGFITADPKRFPSGIKALADYVHSLGLKFGIYSCAGWKTCGGRPAGRGYEFQDAMKYAEWGVDYLKYDWCNTEALKAEGAYLTMRDALYKAGRPIVFSLCEWGDNKPWDWGAKIGHLWRTTGDITDLFYGYDDHGTWKSWGILNIVDMQDGLRKYAGPDHWNDPDMMEVGNHRITDTEGRTHFSMWCMLAAPLIIGTDVVGASEATISTLSNEEAIAIDQDQLGIQGFRFSRKDSLEVWYRPLENGDWAVCFLNRDAVAKTIEYNWAEIVVDDDLSKRKTDFSTLTYTLRDVWAHKEIGTTRKVLKAAIPGHDVLMLRLKPEKK